MSRLFHTLPAVLAMGGLLISSTAMFAKKEYTAKEKKACVYCHTTATSKDLNDVGKCYEKSKSLENCKPAPKK